MESEADNMGGLFTLGGVVLLRVSSCVRRQLIRCGHTPVETAAPGRVTGWTCLLDLENQSVLIAINPRLHQLLNVSRRFPFHPEGPAGP